MLANPEYIASSINANHQQKYIDKPSTQEAKNLYYKAADSITEEAFEIACQEMREKHPRIGVYMDNTWWPYKERIVKFWIDKITHFGQQSTSRVEGWHASLKR